MNILLGNTARRSLCGIALVKLSGSSIDTPWIIVYNRSRELFPKQTPLWQIGVLPMADENMMDMDMQGMLYTLEDEEGNEQEFEVLGELEYEDATYCALVPYHENEEDMLKDDGEFVILKRETIDGEEMLCTIEDDDEYDAVGNMFLQYLNDMFDEEDEEEA